MCKAQQSYLPYLTAVGSGALPLDITIQPCAGYMLTYNAATRNTSHFLPACSITEPTLFDVSHCPIFKLIPIFVSNKDFVVLDFASLPKVDAVHHMGDSGGSWSASTPVVEVLQKRSGSSSSTTENLQKAHEIAKSYSGTDTAANRPTVNASHRMQKSSGTESTSDTGLPTVGAVQQTNHKLKSTTMDRSPNTILGKTEVAPVIKEIEDLAPKGKGEWNGSSTNPLSAISTLTTTNRRSINSSTISPLTPMKIMYSPRTLKSIGRRMLSPGRRNVAMGPPRIFTDVRIVKHENIDSASPILERIKEEDTECQKQATKCSEKAISMSKEVDHD